jgi:hypothetical protein
MGSGIACFVIATVDTNVHPLPLTVTSYVPLSVVQKFEAGWGDNSAPFSFHSYVYGAEDGNVHAVKRTESPTSHIPGLELVSDRYVGHGWAAAVKGTTANPTAM